MNTPWAEQDVLEAIGLREKGLTWTQVGNIFGKSRSACQAAVARYLGITPSFRNNRTYDGPAIGLEQTDINDRNNAIYGSRALADAINSLFERMPARKVAEVLGKAHLCEVPGLQPVLRGQAAIRRLAA